ncbi:hypothetical protein LDENG_00215400, partial [Lucifuga dentata]
LPLYIGDAEVERVSSFKFLGVNITEDLSWTLHTDTVTKKPHQWIYFLRGLRKFGMNTSILTNFYRCTIKSLLMGCIMVWYGNCSAHSCKSLQRMVKAARHIIGKHLLAIQDIFHQRCLRKTHSLKGSQPLSTLPSGRQYRSMAACATRLSNSFYHQAIRLLNS